MLVLILTECFRCDTSNSTTFVKLRLRCSSPTIMVRVASTLGCRPSRAELPPRFVFALISCTDIHRRCIFTCNSDGIRAPESTCAQFRVKGRYCVIRFRPLHSNLYSRGWTDQQNDTRHATDFEYADQSIMGVSGTLFR